LGKKKTEEIDKISLETEVWEEEEENPAKAFEEEKPKVVVETHLEGDKVVAWKDWEHVYDSGYYGKPVGTDRLEIALVEAVLLLKRGRITVKKEGRDLALNELYEHSTKTDSRFAHRYRVYEDLRERGLLVRTGFKFGCDFRVYERGVQLKKGPKSAKEHTKWIVYAVPEDYVCSFQELSRAVRLAHNIRARMLWAIVDNEGDVTYYQITRHKP